MDKITIIIPVYNTEKYINQCIDSVRNQTYENLEIILVDDASPDNCPGKCDLYCKKDSRIKVIHKTNEGLGYARNSGLDIATGDYVTFLDSDDWIDEDHIMNLHNHFKKDIDIVFGGYKNCDNDGKVMKINRPGLSGDIYHEDIAKKVILPMIAPDANNRIELSVPMSVCFNLYRLTLIKDNHLRFISERDCVGEDLFFNLDYLSKSKGVSFIGSSGYNYRVNLFSISRKYQHERIQRTINHYLYLKEKVKELDIIENTEFRIKRSMLIKFRRAFVLIANSDNLSFIEKYSELKKVLNNNYFREIISGYPLNLYRSSIRFTSRLMKNRCTLPVLIIFKILGKKKFKE